MEREVEEAQDKEKRAYRSGHLMCRTSLWGIAGFLACSYFTWVSLGHVRRADYEWTHDGWTAATYIVWVLLLAGLMLDTKCIRERFFFGLLVVNFAVGFALTLWQTVPLHDIRAARIGTGVLWGLAALASLSTVGRAGIVGEKRS